MLETACRVLQSKQGGIKCLVHLWGMHDIRPKAYLQKHHKELEKIRKQCCISMLMVLHTVYSVAIWVYSCHIQEVIPYHIYISISFSCSIYL